MELLKKDEAQHRVARLQSWMRETGVDGLFIMQNADQYYFAGTVQAGLFCLKAEGEPIYLVQKSAARARMESPWGNIIPIASLRKVPDILAGEGLPDPLHLALEMDVLPAGYYLRFKELFPGAGFTDASEAIRSIRMVKSPHEVEQVRRAALMLDKAFARIPAWALPGATELEVSARIEEYLRRCGHQGFTRMRGFNGEIFYGTVSGGASASYPTCFPGPVGCTGLYPAIPGGAGNRRLEYGQSLMVDFIAGYGGYIADKTRTFWLGAPAGNMREAHEFVLHLNGELESMLKPGQPCSRIYRHALDRIEDSPYAAGFMGIGDSRVRFIGHGVGLELDEWPVLASGFDLPLQAGMTIAIEPKIFFPERGGVGIENTYVITENGFEKLTQSREDIIQTTCEDEPRNTRKAPGGISTPCIPNPRSGDT